MRGGEWGRRPYALSRKVTGRRFGVVGLGRIGEAIAKRLLAFGEVAYTARSPKPGPYRFVAGITELARQSDVLILATPSNPSTLNLVDEAVLEALGPEGVLINVGRGSVIDEGALIAALQGAKIAGAALDVYAQEPKISPALRACANVVLSPHAGSATKETRLAMSRLVLRNLNAYLQGMPLPTAVV